MAKRWAGIRAFHPGELLREDVLPAVGKPKAEIARLLGISRQTLYEVLREKQPVTANLALRIAKLVGGDPELWLSLQQSYDLEVAQRALAKELKAIPRLEAAG
jgi:addiction module HigA family antidote